MITLIRLLLALIPVFAGLLIALAAMALLASFGPALIPIAILALGGLAAWIFVTLRR